MAGRFDEDDNGQPWHNRTPAVVGASLLALVVVGILISVAMALSRQFGQPEQAPIDFVEPTFSATASESATTTTQTITSTSPPETTDINPSSTSETSPSETTSSETTSSTTTTTERTTVRTPRQDDDSTRTTRQRPRTNVTRTLNPFP
ncbi:hypothetical protein [Mycolicibacterium moriokaense]|uniref:hypothetical protein n=1 Tax=Mycolicibacterium moriokaense TaxID=39691 RepID=UPI00269BDECC|nr:hypothetical protein [Mycolicibacterium moriokaense]